MLCGGVKVGPTRTRSGCLHFDCITLGVIPDELEAMIESTGAASSMSANNFILKSGRSGPFSGTRSAFDKASFESLVKVKRSLDAPFERPILVKSFQASSTYLRKLVSAFGAGSVAMISNPRARYSADQLAPMTPVPTIAIRRIGLLYDMIFPPICQVCDSTIQQFNDSTICRYFCVSDAGEISLRGDEWFLFRTAEFGGIDRAR